MNRSLVALVIAAAMAAMACSEDVGSVNGGAIGAASSGSLTSGAGGNGGVDLGDEGDPLTVSVPANGKVLVDLDGPAVLDTDDTANDDWELAFEAYDIFTNSGVSGAGSGGAFGPLAVFSFLSNAVPEHPFILEDVTGGAFLRWYAYEGEIHALWSRYHVYGVRSGDDLFKVQILNYYSEVQGAPVSAMYQLRWASVGQTVGDTITITDMDGTAGGLAGTGDDPSGCLALATGDRYALTVAESQASTEWDLCFRRDSISVNGERGGPGDVAAVDVTRFEEPEALPVDVVKTKTAAGELPAFDAVDAAVLSSEQLVYRGDRIVSAFGSGWYAAGAEPTPSDAVWLVQSSDGARKFLVYFEGFMAATNDTPGSIDMRVKEVTD